MADKRQYKLLALDMDGTTLDSGKKFPAEISRAIHALRARGVEVIVSSGRAKAELRDYTRELADFAYGVLLSGGLVYDFRAGKPLFQKALPEEDARSILQAADEAGAMTQFMTVHESVTRGSQIASMADYGMEIYQEMYERVCRREENLADFIREHSNEICKINVYHRDEASREQTLRKLKRRNLTISFAERTALEMSPKGITKAHGLQVVCDYLGIRTDEVVAIGDAPNDIDVLKTAGLAVAMGNAAEEIKGICDVVVADNDHLGVLEAIQRFF